MPAQTIYPHVAGLCRRLGTWRPKTERPLHSQEQTTNKCTFHLTWRSVCVRACVWKRAESRGPRADWSTLAFYPKRPARSLCWRLIQTTGKILIWAHIPLNRTQASPRPRLDAGSASPVYLRRTSIHTITDLVVIYPTT